MHIAILGLGYVGTTTAACLAKAGHHVLGVDINLDKVAAIGAGRSPVVEPMVEELLSAGVSEGRVKSAVAIDGDLDRLDMVIICVGTPSRGDGKLDLSHLLESTRQLGQALRQRRAAEPLLLVFRSTMPPGTMDRLVLPTLERAAGRAARQALRGRLQSRVPARGHGRQGLLRPAQDRRRRARARHHQAAPGHL